MPGLPSHKLASPGPLDKTSSQCSGGNLISLSSLWREPRAVFRGSGSSQASMDSKAPAPASQDAENLRSFLAEFVFFVSSMVSSASPDYFCPAGARRGIQLLKIPSGRLSQARMPVRGMSGSGNVTGKRNIEDY